MSVKILIHPGQDFFLEPVLSLTLKKDEAEEDKPINVLTHTAYCQVDASPPLLTTFCEHIQYASSSQPVC